MRADDYSYTYPVTSSHPVTSYVPPTPPSEFWVEYLDHTGLWKRYDPQFITIDGQNWNPGHSFPASTLDKGAIPTAIFMAKKNGGLHRVISSGHEMVYQTGPYGPPPTAEDAVQLWHEPETGRAFKV